MQGFFVVVAPVNWSLAKQNMHVLLGPWRSTAATYVEMRNYVGWCIAILVCILRLPLPSLHLIDFMKPFYYSYYLYDIYTQKQEMVKLCQN